MVEISLEDGDGILHSPYLLILPSTPSRILWAVDKKLKEDGDKSDAKSTGISTLTFFREFRQGRKGHTEVLRGDAVEADQGGDRTTRWQCCTTSFIG